VPNAMSDAKVFKKKPINSMLFYMLEIFTAKSAVHFLRNVRLNHTRWAKNVSPFADEATFSLKLNVEQATEVNANKHLLVFNILSIKYSMYDVKCDVNYCVILNICVYCLSRRPTHPSICY